MLSSFLLYNKVTQLYIHIFFFILISITVYHKMLKFPMLYHRTLFAHTIYNFCICQAQTCTPSLPKPLPLGNHRPVLRL